MADWIIFHSPDVENGELPRNNPDPNVVISQLDEYTALNRYILTTRDRHRSSTSSAGDVRDNGKSKISSNRERVSHACNRCRIKKSKCDGANPCRRCRSSNMICVFAKRKQTHNKVYSNEYVEMLEQQQVWLVSGLQELYRRTTDGKGWPDKLLRCEPSGHPLTHDILARLGILDEKKDEQFEENMSMMQQRGDREPYMQWQDSSNNSSGGVYLPITLSVFPDVISQGNCQQPPIPQTSSLSTRAERPLISKIELQIPQNSDSAQLSQVEQQIFNPVAVEWLQNHSFDGPSFDEVDFIVPTESTTNIF